MYTFKHDFIYVLYGKFENRISWSILYSYIIPVCSIVKTFTPRCRGRTDALLHEAEGPSAIVHQVVHGTEG